MLSSTTRICFFNSSVRGSNACFIYPKTEGTVAGVRIICIRFPPHPTISR